MMTGTVLLSWYFLLGFCFGNPKYQSLPEEREIRRKFACSNFPLLPVFLLLWYSKVTELSADLLDPRRHTAASLSASNFRWRYLEKAWERDEMERLLFEAHNLLSSRKYIIIYISDKRKTKKDQEVSYEQSYTYG